MNLYYKRFYLKNKDKYKQYYQDNKEKIKEYIQKRRKEVTNVHLNYRDRYILTKLYEYIKNGKNKCYLQKQNIDYFNENKQKFIGYYHMIKESKKVINHLDELNTLGEKNFNIEFCNKKCYENNQLKIERGKFILTFD